MDFKHDDHFRCVSVIRNPTLKNFILYLALMSRQWKTNSEKLANFLSISWNEQQRQVAQWIDFSYMKLDAFFGMCWVYVWIIICLYVLCIHSLWSDVNHFRLSRFNLTLKWIHECVYNPIIIWIVTCQIAFLHAQVPACQTGPSS